jgi:hypothetical protein
MHEAVDRLEAAAPTTDPAEMWTVTNKALASAITVIARADDSGGVIGDACQRLLELHPKAAAAARVPARKLIDWMIKFQFDGEVDYFSLNPVAYAPALGETGVAAYRARLREIEQSLGPRPAERSASNHGHEWFLLDWNAQRLAVLDRDIQAIIRTHARDRKVAAWFEDTAKAFEEIGEIDLAIDWANQAADFDRGHQSKKAGDYWCRLLEQHRPTEALAARAEVFGRWPSANTAAQLHRTVGNAWPDHRDGVLAGLSASPYDAVVFALTTLKDPELAWELAHSLSLDSDRAWSDLAKAYEQIDPLATLSVHRRLVEQALVEAGAQHYRLAARRLTKMRKLAAGTEHAADVDTFITDLRETHRRRPRLLHEFNRAALP